MKREDTKDCWQVGTNVPLIWPGQVGRIEMLICFQYEQALSRSRSGDCPDKLFHVVPALAVEKIGWRAEDNPRMFSSERLVS